VLLLARLWVRVRDWLRGPLPRQCTRCGSFFDDGSLDGFFDHYTTGKCRPPTPELREIYVELDDDFPGVAITPTDDLWNA